jgi:hypothetical protein
LIGEGGHTICKEGDGICIQGVGIGAPVVSIDKPIRGRPEQKDWQVNEGKGSVGNILPLTPSEGGEYSYPFKSILLQRGHGFYPPLEGAGGGQKPLRNKQRQLP